MLSASQPYDNKFTSLHMWYRVTFCNTGKPRRRGPVALEAVRSNTYLVVVCTARNTVGKDNIPGSRIKKSESPGQCLGTCIHTVQHG